MSVHDGRDASVVDVAVALGHVLDDGNGLLLSLVGQHGSKCNITDAADVGDLGSVFRVDDDATSLVQLKADVLKAQALSVGSSANGDQNHLRVDL